MDAGVRVWGMADGDNNMGREVSGVIIWGGESNVGSSMSSGVNIRGGAEEHGVDMGEVESAGGLHIAIRKSNLQRGKRNPSN